MYTILQIIISIVVVYLLFSTVVNVIVEGISGVLKLRGKMLAKAVLHLFENTALGHAIYDHPRIKSLKAPDNKPPSYIPAASIASAIVDIVASKSKTLPTKDNTLDRFLEGAATYEGYVKTLLGTFAVDARRIEDVIAAIEKWFNDAMDRVSGWYKRQTKTIIVIVAIAVTTICNVDTIVIIKAAKSDPVLRQRLNDLGDKLVVDSVIIRASAPAHDVDYYEDYVNDESIQDGDSVLVQTQGQPVPNPTLDERLSQLKYLNEAIGDAQLPIGWPVKTKIDWMLKILGWLLTVFALSAGAPFWFDVLKKFINIRTTGPNPIEKK